MAMVPLAPKLCMVGMMQDVMGAMMIEEVPSVEDRRVEIVDTDRRTEPDLLDSPEEIGNPFGSRMREAFMVTIGEIGVTPQGRERTSIRGRGITNPMPTKTQGRKGGIDSTKRNNGLLVGFRHFQPFLISFAFNIMGKDQNANNIHMWAVDPDFPSNNSGR